MSNLPRDTPKPMGRANPATMQHELNNLRKYLAMGASPTDIMHSLNLSFNQYVRYMKKLAAQDRKIIDNDENLRDDMYVQLSILKDRLNGIVSRCTRIASAEEVPVGARLEAEKILAEASLAILKITFEGSTILRELSPEMRDVATGAKRVEELPVIQTTEQIVGVDNKRDFLVEGAEKDSEQAAEDSEATATK